MKHELETRQPTLEENPFLDTQILTEQEVVERSQLIGYLIERQYNDDNPLIVSVHEGGKYFTDVLKKYWERRDFRPEFTSIKAKRTSDESELRPLEILQPIPEDIDLTGRTVIITEDMIDEGDTLAGIVAYLYERGAAKVIVVVMIARADVERDPDCPKPDFVGFYLHSDGWAIGSGLDDLRMVKKDSEYSGNIPNDGGRSWPGIWLNFPPPPKLD